MTRQHGPSRPGPDRPGAPVRPPAGRGADEASRDHRAVAKGRQGLATDLAGLQRRAGNRAVNEILSGRRLRLPEPPGGGSARSRVPPGARWRLPPSADLQAMLTAGTVPADVVQSRVRTLLKRMQRENRLRVAASLADTMAAIFPSPGTLDVAAYDRFLDPADRTMVYESVNDAVATPRAADHGDLRRAMRSAATAADNAAGDEAGLRAVFGVAQWRTARTRYRLIKDRLHTVAGSLATSVTTDYNLDAEETFLGGWADFGAQHMHLLSEVVADPMTDGSRATLLHEAAHLAHADIDDHVYYGSTGFEAADDATKVGNAAHYEELPRRAWGDSSYDGVTFTPGRSSGGAALTVDERIRAGATEFYRRAWDAAADLDDLAKGARRDELAGRRIGRRTRARLLEASPLMDLTFHKQSSRAFTITRLDVTTTESVTRAMGLAGDLAESEPITLMGPFPSDADHVAMGVPHLVDAAIASYGALLGSATRDRRLIDWLHGRYGNMFP